MRRTIALITVAAITTACGRTGAPARPTDQFSHPTGADETILSVISEGGFAPAMEYNLTQLPGFTLAGDGSIYTPGPMIEIYPPPAVPVFQAQTVNEAGIQGILQAADEAGLMDGNETYSNTLVTDAPTTVFSITADDLEHTTSVYALGMGTDQLEEPDKSDVQAIEAFNTRLMDLSSWLPEGSLGEQSLYDPQHMQVYVLDAPQPDPDLPQKSANWPLSRSLAAFGSPDASGGDFRCGVLSGEDLATVLDVADGTNQQTPWRSGDQQHQLIFRPLLPTEPGCGASAASADAPGA